MDVAEFLEDVSRSCQAISSLPLVTPAQSRSLSHSSHSSPSSRTALRRLQLGALLLPHLPSVLLHCGHRRHGAARVDLPSLTASASGDGPPRIL
jgi:hypothetical protein